MSLDAIWRELRRRKVVRVVVAYAAVAFVVIQVGDIVFPALSLPDWTMTLVVVLAGLGFPVAVALAWAFDIGPSGIQRAPPDASTPPGRRTTLAVPVAAAAVLVGLLAAVWSLFGRSAPGDDALDAGLVAVIPFRVSADPSFGYLREGMVDLMAATLTGESGPRAADPRTSMSAWRRVVRSEDEDLTPEEATRVARIIGAGNVLLGSIVGNASRLTLSARIVTIPAGRQGLEAKAEGPADSLSMLVDHVTAQLHSLEAGVTNNRLASFTSTSLPAVRAYLRGQAQFRQSRFEDAARGFDEALQLDSSFALAALGLRLTVGWGLAPVPFSGRAVELATRYRDRLAPGDRALLDALVGTGETRTTRQRIDDWERTVERFPDRPEVWFQYGDEVIHRGPVADEPDHARRAKDAFDRALQLDSSFTPALVHLIDGELFDNPDRTEFRRLHALLARGDASAEVAPYQYWARVLAIGDTAAVRAVRASMDTASTGTLFWFIYYYPVFGLGELSDVERTVEILHLRASEDPAVESAAPWQYAHTGLVALGRPTATRALLEGAIGGAANPTPWLIDAVDEALHAEGDSAFAAAAADRLELLMTGDTTAAAGEPCARLAAGERGPASPSIPSRTG